jgi:hypothetical protein
MRITLRIGFLVGTTVVIAEVVEYAAVQNREARVQQVAAEVV